MFGLHWVRRRQRDLAKAVLALFCLAWLQAAAVPCVMADDVQPVASQAMPMASAHHDCRYCPPLQPGAPAGADHQGTCVYPHEPQVDARASSGLFFIVPVAQHIATLSFQPIETIASAGPLGDVVSRTPLAVSYCRFIE